VDITKELPTVIAFCAGYGGIERGLDLAGVEHRVIAYVEIEAFAIANLVNKMETGQLRPAPIYTDLKTFPAKLFRGRVDIITGGYPCQPFSAAGNRLGADDPRHLWPHIRRHIKSIRPVRCFFENVEGHISLGLSSVISDLEEDGYRTTWGIFSAREVGAPHQRKRVYILANSQSAGGRGTIRPVSSQNDSVGQPQEHRKDQSIQLEYASKNGACAELGNTKHNEPSDTTIRGGFNSPGNDNTQGKDGSCKLEGASESKISGDLSGGELADPSGKGLQGGERLPGDTRQDRERRERADGSATERGNGCKQSIGEAEPRLGGGFDGASSWVDGSWELGIDRVISECPDRVDRVRQLGNGVVPQTAAKAWDILSKRLNYSHRG